MLHRLRRLITTHGSFMQKSATVNGQVRRWGQRMRTRDFSIALLLLIAFATIWNHSSQHKSSRLQTSPMLVTVSERFGPTIANKTTAPGTAPREMVWISGGEFSMGAQDPPDMDEVGMRATFDSRPIHRVYVDGFYMDKTDVTNGQFAEFVSA